jgi:hypothetical protein
VDSERTRRQKSADKPRDFLTTKTYSPGAEGSSEEVEAIRAAEMAVLPARFDFHLSHGLRKKTLEAEKSSLRG